QQDFSLVDPQYGLTCSWPVHVIDPSESWLANCPLTPPGRFDQAPPVRLRDLPLRMEP
ncbi:MAG: hypothetical protein HY822_18270, partial [Acidobacteria bacterium]|nr:hypothetical protein [Acidobacteriota bacterium]